MSADNRHHKTKRNRYSVVIAHNEDGSKVKNFSIAVWHLFAGGIVLLTFTIAIVVLILTYTPFGQIFPLTNRGLEEKYSKEFVEINKQITSMVNELLEMRAYNAKLKRILGEKVGTQDTTKKISSAPIYTYNNVDANVSSMRKIETTANQLGEYQNHYSGINTNASYSVSFPAIMPSSGYITRGFEPENNHYGIDIAGKIGSLIVASAEGYVVFSGWTYNDGYQVILSHSNGFLSFYKHNQSVLKSVGAFVKRGEPIATLGNSGTTSFGPHVHFEIWKNGNPVDPSLYMLNLYL